jgi:FkbM family methyltransferase
MTANQRPQPEALPPAARVGSFLLSLPYARKVGTVAFMALAGAYRRLLALRGGPVDVVSARDGIRFRLDISEWVQMRIFFDRFIPTYDVEELAFAKTCLRPGDVAVDVGAQVGLYALTFSRAVGASGKVVAFEPDPRNRERLAANLQLNPFAGNVEIVPRALSDRSGDATLYRSSDTGHNSMRASVATESRVDEIAIEAVTLDEYCRQHALERIRLIKIDVEGHEAAVLAGAAGMLAAGRIDYVMMEYVAERARGLGMGEELGDAALTACGYRRVFPQTPPERWPKVTNLVYAGPGIGGPPIGGRATP